MPLAGMQRAVTDGLPSRHKIEVIKERGGSEENKKKESKQTRDLHGCCPCRALRKGGWHSHYCGSCWGWQGLAASDQQPMSPPLHIRGTGWLGLCNNVGNRNKTTALPLPFLFSRTKRDTCIPMHAAIMRATDLCNGGVDVTHPPT